MKITRHPKIVSTLKPSNLPYLSGPWTPLAEEVVAVDLDVVEGRLPTDIDGIYLRNTQNQIHQPRGRFHPFDGDGMIHQIDLHGGKASYRNRWVRTRGFAAEQEAGQALYGSLMEPVSVSQRRGQCVHPGLKDASSTDVVVHAKSVLSTYYQCGEGYRVNPETLETLGLESWVPIDGISAHTKVDERTGELLFFNYSLYPPYMHYGVVDRDNRLVHYIPVALPGPRLPHDMCFTENYAILNDLPVYWDPDLLAKNIYAVRFYRNQKTRFAILPRRGGPDQIRWFEADPTYVLHWVNAYEEGDEIVLDGYFQEDPTPKPTASAPAGYEHMMGFLDLHAMRTRLHRWRFNLKTGRTREERLSDLTVEFGTMNQRYAGRPYRYCYSALSKPGMFLFNGLVKHDLKTGETSKVMLADDEYASESPFAPRIDAQDEDDGYVITFTINQAKNRSECLLIDAKRFAEGPVCRILLPHKICSGTHSTWASRELLADGYVKKAA
ncbi:MAG: carotenoid oxygenase family protein [Rhodospirillaceae bacterium]|nr:carotenoid oxygenase family protein [Rhodospirillaceae bacterium]